MIFTEDEKRIVLLQLHGRKGNISYGCLLNGQLTQLGSCALHNPVLESLRSVWISLLPACPGMRVKWVRKPPLISAPMGISLFPLLSPLLPPPASLKEWFRGRNLSKSALNHARARAQSSSFSARCSRAQCDLGSQNCVFFPHCCDISVKFNRSTCI